MKVVKKGYDGPRVKDTATFIEKAVWQHGDKYDYSLVDYKKASEKVRIICPEHGEFLQRPTCHNNNAAGCPSCKFEKLRDLQLHSTDSFIEACVNVHGNKYDYSKVNYTGDKNKVVIICPDHGEFTQLAGGHKAGRGCIMCGFEKSASSCRSNAEEFILSSKEVHGDKYDYSSVEYVNTDTKVSVVCPDHGQFHVTPYKHVKRRYGCPDCGKSRRGWTYSNPIYMTDEECSHLYLIKLIDDYNGTNFIKVGLSVNPEARHKQIARESGYSVVLLYILKGTGRRLHKTELEVLHWSNFEKYAPDREFAGSSECFKSGQTTEMIRFIEDFYNE